MTATISTPPCGGREGDVVRPALPRATEAPETDEALVAAFRAGDREAFDRLVGRWQRSLHGFVYRLVGRREEARDVCQETFLRVWTRADRFDDGARFSTWMYQIALNLCRDLARRRQRWGRLLAEPDRTGERSPTGREPADGAESAEERAVRESERRIVRRALDGLSPEQREVIVLKEFQGLKFREIARILGCPESTVKSRMYHGLANLRAALPAAGPAREARGESRWPARK